MRSVLSILLVLGLASGAGTAQEDISAEHRELFDEDILPILEENCFKCHGGEVVNGGIDLSDFRGDLDVWRYRFTFTKVLDMLGRKVMPPEDEPPPTKQSGWNF